MSPVPFEHALTDCYEMTPSGDYNIRTMIIQQHIDVDYYAIVVHLIPDIIFRAPTPIIAIAILTVRTLQICSTRTIGTQTIQARRNVPYMLTLLNIKFIMCNTLYMFNTILMEVLGYGGKIRTMIIQQHIDVDYYAIVVHLIPDIIFRAPTPIIAIAILTVRTLQICSTRTIGTQTIQARRNVPYMLTLLNIKFIMCNTLYMFNTILMEVLGYGGKI
uniref:Uncharacterized protein n=1 Tax=Panagrolaimus sp. JU765 TaxID=591449 RepID=A0AC34PXD8_9BILA